MRFSTALSLALLPFTLGYARVVERQVAPTSITSVSVPSPSRPRTLIVSGQTEVILATTDYQGSFIIVTQRLTTDNSHSLVTEYIAATTTLTGLLGPITQIQVPIPDENGKLVVATGILITNPDGQATTSFSPIVVSEGLSSHLTEFVRTKTNALDDSDFMLGQQRVGKGAFSLTGSRGSSTDDTWTSASATYMGSRSTSAIVSGTTLKGPSSLSPQSSASVASVRSSSQTSTRSHTSTAASLTVLRTDPSESLLSSPKHTIPSSSQRLNPSSTVAVPRSTQTISTSTPSITSGPVYTSQVSLTGYGIYPETITFLSQSNGQEVVGLAFVTTNTDGSKIVTNTIPPQSSVSGGIALVEGTVTVIVNPSTIPVATPLPTPSGVLIVTGSAGPVTYEPLTLTQYANISQPFELSTVFTEVINGQTTTQAGVWLVGAGGVIEVPRNKLWGDDDNIIGGVHIIDDPLYGNMPGGTVVIGGGFAIHFPDPNLKFPGPPSFPGFPKPKPPKPGPRPIDEPPPPYPDDPPPPYPDESEAEEEEEEEEEEEKTDQKTNEEKTDEPKTTEQQITQQQSQTSATADHPASTSAITTLSSAAPGCGTLGCYIIAATNYDSVAVESLLQSWDPQHAQATPEVPSNVAAGGMWFSRKLDVLQFATIASRQDILAIGPSTTNSAFSKILPDTSTIAPDPSDSTISDDTSTAVATPAAQKRDAVGQQQPHPEPSTGKRENRRQDSVSPEENATVLDGPLLWKRDPGNRLIREYYAQADLAVLSWAPGHDTFPNDDPDMPLKEAFYVFEESKCEGTWAYVVDSGVDTGNIEFLNNWADPSRTNIDPNWIWANDILRKEEKDYEWHGTSTASKITGNKHGVCRQATIIPVVCLEYDSSSHSALYSVLLDLPNRRARGEALPGKTVMIITWPVKDERLWESFKVVFKYLMQDGIIIIASAGNYKGLDPAEVKGAGPKCMLPPQMWASDDFPIIRVGGTDLQGKVADFSQEADIHTVGIPAWGAHPTIVGDYDADGTCGAAATFAGLVLYELARNPCRIPLGDDISQYSRIVRDYYMTGDGAWQRPYGDVRVAWNHIDGSRDTTCPLENMLKRDVQANSACARPSSISSAKSVRASSGDPSSTLTLSVHTTPGISSSTPTASVRMTFVENGGVGVPGGGGDPGGKGSKTGTGTRSTASFTSTASLWTFQTSTTSLQISISSSSTLVGSTTSKLSPKETSVASKSDHQQGNGPGGNDRISTFASTDTGKSSTSTALSSVTSRSLMFVSTASDERTTVVSPTPPISKTSMSSSIATAQATSLLCNGLHTPTFADRQPVLDAIVEFCEDDIKRNANNQQQLSKTTYGLDQSGKIISLNYFSLSIFYVSSSVPRLTVDQCKAGLNHTVEDCDSADNPSNGKHGGRFEYQDQANLDFTPSLSRAEYAGAPSAKLSCGASTPLHYASPTNLKPAIQSFCSQATQELPTWGPYPVAGTIYNAKTDDNPNGNVYNKDTPESFILSITWRGIAYVWYEDECIWYLNKIVDGCLVFASNTIFAYGGTFSINSVDYTIAPQWVRQPAVAAPKAVCGEWDTAWGGVKYEVHGAGWELNDWGRGSGGLLDWTNHYAATDWNFDYTGDGNSDPEGMEWVAYGHNAWETDFTEYAVSQAGGPADCRVGNQYWPWPSTNLKVKRGDGGGAGTDGVNGEDEDRRSGTRQT